MGWRLQMAPPAATPGQRWPSRRSARSAVDQAIALASLDPGRLANGVWRLRLTAWDLSGRSGEIETRVVIDSPDKAAPAGLVADATTALAGHTPSAVTRLLSVSLPPQTPTPQRSPPSRRLRQLALPLLDTQFSSDQPATDASGATAAWLEGARVWLTLPASLSGDARRDSCR